MIIFHCDMCGYAAPMDNRCGISVQTGPVPKSDPSFTSLFGGASVPPQERFDLCLECALRIVVVLKAGKSRLNKEVTS